MKDYSDMLPIESYSDPDNWYDYVINDYIPNKHPEDMGLFVKIGFSPEIYYIYQKYKMDKGNQEIREAIRNKFKKEFNLDIGE